MKNLQARIETLEAALDFFGIIVDLDGTLTYKPSSIDKWRKVHNDTEVAELKERIKELENKL